MDADEYSLAAIIESRAVPHEEDHLVETRSLHKVIDDAGKVIS